MFVRRKGDPGRAETFLQEALKSYVSEGWSLPVTHTRRQIAECQKLLGRTDEYPVKNVNYSTYVDSIALHLHLNLGHLAFVQRAMLGRGEV